MNRAKSTSYNDILFSPAFPPPYFPLLRSSFLLGVFTQNKLLNSCSSLSEFTCVLPQWDALVHPFICHVILIPNHLIFPDIPLLDEPHSSAALFSSFLTFPLMSPLFFLFLSSCLPSPPSNSSTCYFSSLHLYLLFPNMPLFKSPLPTLMSNNSVMVELVCRAPSYQLLWL